VITICTTRFGVRELSIIPNDFTYGSSMVSDIIIFASDKQHSLNGMYNQYGFFFLSEVGTEYLLITYIISLNS
jgi:hypothetical protein